MMIPSSSLNEHFERLEFHPGMIRVMDLETLV